MLKSHELNKKLLVKYKTEDLLEVHNLIAEHKLLSQVHIACSDSLCLIYSQSQI